MTIDELTAIRAELVSQRDLLNELVEFTRSLTNSVQSMQQSGGMSGIMARGLLPDANALQLNGQH